VRCCLSCFLGASVVVKAFVSQAREDQVTARLAGCSKHMQNPSSCKLGHKQLSASVRCHCNEHAMPLLLLVRIVQNV
jgi:hypothetical protein